MGIFIWGNGKKEFQKLSNDYQHWSQVECGGTHYAALSLGKSVYIWGKGKEGQLGLGSENQRDHPTLVPLYYSNSSPIKIKSIACGPLQTAAISGLFCIIIIIIFFLL